MKPLKLRTRHMPTKVTKPPKKGKGAKYDRKQQKKVSDGVIKLAPLVEVILKVKRIKLLVEGMIREASLGGWRTYFVVGPDSKVIEITGEYHNNYHGDAIRKYPAIYNAAEKLFGNTEKLNTAIEDGQLKLYKFMYDNHMIRGGSSWLAFNSRKVKPKSLMVILQLAKESGKTRFDVEDAYNGKFYHDMTIDEFIEKFL